MKAGPGRQIDLSGKFLSDQLLQTDELDKREVARWVIVDEEIDIAVGGQLISAAEP